MIRPNIYFRWRRLRPRDQFFVLACIAFSIEWIFHLRAYSIHRQPKALRDAPFYSGGCQEPDASGPRENAVVVMLVRNNEGDRAVKTLRSFEEHFNRWFHYPVVFLNDVPFEKTFVDEISKIPSGDISFEVIPDDLWSYPNRIDPEKARKSYKDQADRGLLYAGMESYHHMCRFHSGKFYDHPALKKYKWFWRVDSDLEFVCSIPYDPFVQMAKHNKRYGYAMAVIERSDTVPNLFRVVDRYRQQRGLGMTPLYNALISASWSPIFLRKLVGKMGGRNDEGDSWNMCHFWSNFEIGDMDFFRSRAYRDYFDMLDNAGGFYFERWGDAPVHSFGAAMLLQSHEIHYFEDIGYIHDNLQHCPANARGGQLPDSPSLGKGEWDPEKKSGVGCRCKCKPTANNVPMGCQKKLDRALR